MDCSQKNPVRDDIIIVMQHAWLPKPRKGWHYKWGCEVCTNIDVEHIAAKLHIVHIPYFMVYGIEVCGMW